MSAILALLIRFGVPQRFAKAVAIVIAVIAALALLWTISTVRSCQQAAQDAAQSRVDQGQAGAYANSAQAAIEAQGAVNANASASEELSRTNEQDIRHAKGADQAVDPAVRDAGFASLCRRASFRNSPSGRVRCPIAPVVAPAR